MADDTPDTQQLPLPQAPLNLPSMTPAPPSLATGTGGAPSTIVPITGQAPSQIQLPPREPGTSIASQPQQPTKGQIFRQMLGDFFYAAGTGLANAGHGPGAQERGAGAAMTALPQRDIMRQQLEIQRTQAEGMQEYHKAQAESLTPSIKMLDPDGNPVMVPPAHVGQALGAQYRLAGTQAAVAGREQVANITAKNRMDVEQMKALLAANQIARLVPVKDQNGKPQMEAISKYGNSLGYIDGAIPPTSYLGTTKTGVTYKQLDDGTIVPLPNTTITTPNTGGGGGGVARGGMGQPVTDQQGQPLIGKGAVTSTTRTMVETAPKVIDLVDRISAQIDDLDKSGALGPGMSRWNEFWAGKVGADNPKFKGMTTNTTLLSTLLMRMHMGARGGQQIMEHFDKMIGSGHQSAENMRATLEQIKLYANDVKGATPLPANYGKSNAASPKAGTVIQYDENGNRR